MSAITLMCGALAASHDLGPLVEIRNFSAKPPVEHAYSYATLTRPYCRPHTSIPQTLTCTPTPRSGFDGTLKHNRRHKAYGWWQLLSTDSGQLQLRCSVESVDLVLCIFSLSSGYHSLGIRRWSFQMGRGQLKFSKFFPHARGAFA